MDIPPHYAVVRVFGLLLLSAMANWAVAQCDFVFDQVIPDNGTISFVLEVDDLVMDDLSAGQAVCGVNLKFRHNYLGDLTIDLQSPAGQTVQLVGPVTDQISPTNLTTWEVGFVPCLSGAIPDAGFSDVWSNDQGWQVFALYTGSYYPSSGCLQDFNTGSANGKWVLTLTDADLTAIGRLLSVELIFCDNAGLTCIICDADAGEFDVPDIQMCEGGTVSDALFIPDFVANQPDTVIYNYSYLVSEDDVAYNVQSAISGAGWPVGSYTICGLTYAVSDSGQLFAQFDTMTFRDIQMAFGNDEIDHCAEMTEPCIRFNVYPIPDTTRLVESICSGSVFQVGNEIFNQEGEYTIDLVSTGGCDSVVCLNLDVINVNVKISQLDTLTCDNLTTSLSAAESTLPGIPIYSWETMNGSIMGPSNQATILIGSPGRYTVTVTDFQSGCSRVKSWEAVDDGSLPFVLVPDGIINCVDTSHTFEPIVFPLDVSFEWAGPGGFIDSVQNPVVTVGGTYFMTVTDGAGCRSIAEAIVNYDTMQVISANIKDTKNCDGMITVLAASPPGQQSYSWSGPMGYTSQDRSILPPFVGTYTVDVMQLNGCVVSDSIIATHDYTIPDITISAAKDSISCGETIVLSASSSLAQTVFNWSGPGLSTSDTNQIGTTSPGIYVVEGVAPNLCKSNDTLEMHPGLGLADMITFTDTITCAKDTVSIGVISLGQVISYSWSGPGMIDSTFSFIRVVKGGIYEVEMLDISGCVQKASVEVALDIAGVDFRFISDTITCIRPIVDLTFITDGTVKNFEWELPSSQILYDSIISVETGDRHFLTVIGENGCARTKRHNVVVDTLKPLVFMESTLYGCYDSIQLLPYFPDSVTNYQWTGPSGFVSDQQNPFIYEAGDYSLRITGLNGCMTSKKIVVVPDDVSPAVMAMSELLDCIDSTAILNIASPDTMVTFEWFLQGTQLGDSASLTVNSPGQYVVVATASNNCQSLDTIDVAPTLVPMVYSREDTINCRDTSVELLAMSDSSDVNFSWFDSQGASLGTGATLSVSEPGIYHLAGQWTNGCTFDTTVMVDIDTIHPLAIASTDEVIKCLIQDIYLSGEASLGDSLLYSWTTPDGNILIGESSDSVFIHGQGQYILIVEEGVNHCRDSDTLTIEEQSSTLKSLGLTIFPECRGNLAGAIIFDTVIQAETELIYSIGLNGGSTNPVFDSLAKGVYTVSVVDSFGCTLDSLVSITDTGPETVDLGPDLDILIGDPAPLMATLNIDSSILSAISWDSEMPCNFCLSNVLYLQETQSFTIYVRDAAGCLASDDVTVFVRERGQAYVPNIFTPNNDGINDLLPLYAHPGIRYVKQFRILDRWGNQVFGVENIDPHMQQIEWDGKFMGQEVNPAVFAYVLEIELITGRIEFHSGDITLLR